jgi:hypothetical protein
MNRGDKYRPVVTVLKVKKGVPTVIRVSGREYVLRAPDQFNQRRQGAVKRDDRTTSH